MGVGTTLVNYEAREWNKGRGQNYKHRKTTDIMSLKIYEAAYGI